MASTSRTEPPSPATCQANFEQGVALALHLWPALALAVQNHWGGPDSEDKRDWFAGAVVDLFPDLSKPKPANGTPAAAAQRSQQQQQPADSEEPDQVDVESVLLQVMLDEFEVNVDDESAFETAEQIMRVRAGCLRGAFDEVDGLQRRFDARKGGAGKVAGMFKKGEDQDADTDWDTEEDDDDDEGEDGDEDVRMEDAPALVPARKEKEAPEVDEDGFTTVARKKR